LKVAILGRTEARAAFRPLALSHASRLILERLDVWPSLEVTPIETIRVSQQQAFGRTVMQAADAGVPALGYVTEYSALVSLLQAKCEGLFVQGEVQARCVVHAGGAARAAAARRALRAHMELPPRARRRARELRGEAVPRPPRSGGGTPSRRAGAGRGPGAAAARPAGASRAG